jgi:1-phosphatidylinositol-3-phosphate 5-kinase
MASHAAPGDTRRDAPSPSRSTSSIPHLPRDSRRTSLASQASSKPPLDQTVVAQTLQKIHTAASRTDTLTTFDFGSPPRPPSGGDAKAFGADLVPGGFSGLYSRIKASVSRDPVPPSPTNESDGASVISLKHQSAASKPPDGLSIVSPGTASGSSSRLQSPSVAQFPTSDTPKSHLHSPSSSSIVPGTIASALRATDSDHIPRSIEQQSFQPAFSASRTRTPDGSRVVRHNESPSNRTTRQDRDIDGLDAKEAYGVHLLSDNDRTPRPMSRLVPSAEKQPNQFPSRERDISRSRNGSNATDRLAMPDLHPPVIQVSQSYLPGFRASRETSIDGDYSSVASGTNTTGKLKADRPDEARQNIALPGSEVTPASASRLRSKVLAKELWMRDETAKECFYCGEPFSTFRRKHHCRKYIFNPLNLFMHIDISRHLWKYF